MMLGGGVPVGEVVGLGEKSLFLFINTSTVVGGGIGIGRNIVIVIFIIVGPTPNRIL